MFRLLAEGAITSAARSVVPRTLIETGQACGVICGVTKAELEEEAKALLRVTSFGAVYAEATAAAIAAFRVS